MELSRPQPIEQNFKDIRMVRQDNNNKIVCDSLMKKDKTTFYENINYKEYERVLKDLELSEEEFMLKCTTDYLFAKISSRTISKNASRQGTRDETEQLRTCDITAKKCGLVIDNLTVAELRPTKDGNIVSKNEMKSKNIEKDCCLK